MALREEFESAGNWLFRWRSYLPIVLLALLFLSMRDYQYPGQSEPLSHVWELVCLLVSLAGLGVRVFAIGHTPRRTSGRNTREQIADTLNTTGIYSAVRHPLYVGNFLMGLGIFLFPFLWWLALIYTLSYCVYYERIMFAEEAFLRGKFGEQFTRWAERTPAFIPSFRHYVRPDLPFSLKNVLKREYNGFFAVIVLMFALDVAGDRVVHGEFTLDLAWAIIMGISFVLWLVLRILKRRTRLLHVEGR